MLLFQITSAKPILQIITFDGRLKSQDLLGNRKRTIVSARKRLFYFGILMILWGSLIGCKPSLIEIGNVQQKRKGKVVYLTGKVSHTAPFVGNSAYKLQDDTGSVWVVTENSTPILGKVISIKGKIQYQSLPFAERELGDFYVIELEQLELPAEINGLPKN